MLVQSQRNVIDSSALTVGRGPIVVDSGALVNALHTLHEDASDVSAASLRLPPGTKVMATDSLVRCAQASWEHGCVVVGDAVLMSLGEVEKDSAGFTAYVTVSRTYESPIKGVCPVQTRYRLETQAGRWSVTERRNLSAC